MNFAQDKTFNNWNFGKYTSITFNTNPPSYTQNSSLNSWESCASISDTSGSLLFYTDGIQVWNKNNIQMPNGFGLKADNSTTQGAIIVPYPNHPNLFFIFTLDSENGYFGGCGCLAYSVVDISLQGGLGDVTFKNTTLYTGITEKLSVTKHQNDTSYWIVARGYNMFYLSYLLSPNGISSSPVISNAPVLLCCESFPWSVGGQMKISPDSKKIAGISVGNRTIELSDFNSQTGQITNSKIINTGIKWPYGLEFSPNSKLLYITDANPPDASLFQFNISSNNTATITNSKTKIYQVPDTVSRLGQLQLGPDNKIYCANVFNNSLDVIDKPNKIGTSCNFIYGAIPLSLQSGTYYSIYGLPNRISNHYYDPFIDYSDDLIDTICENFDIPNVITPNNDNVNDMLYITCENKRYIPEDLIIYNRWGTEVYNESKKLNMFNNVPNGTYFYIFTFQDNKYKGFIELFH
ncbi:MAG TPA: gliding motility-associated C-terminal domain-containing protein [Bacteroidia bacterium]|nr:gliding motility-associated C-terminal domain-containing protein [Bacteroidia bacterium]